MSILSKHVPIEELMDFADSRLSDENREAVGVHISSCDQCAAVVGRLESTLQLMKADKSVDAPRDVLMRAVSIFKRAEKSSIVKQLIASLSFDSSSLAPAFGTRSGQTQSRQLIFTAEEHDIDLHISTEDDKWIIAGQILGEDCQRGEVQLAGENILLSSSLDESCEFMLPAVPAGDYKLRLRLADLEVEVPRLELRK